MISLTGGVKENIGILLLFLNMGAAPSSGDLDHAKSVSLFKLLLVLMEYHVCIGNCVDYLNLVTLNPRI